MCTVGAERIHSHLNIPKFVVVLNLLSPFFFTLPKNVKLDVLIKIRLKKGRSSS